MRTFLFAALLAALPLPCVAADERPNFLVLFSDDGGYADFGFQPHADPKLAALTPRLTKFAASGARLTNGYVSGCVCSPSRAGLMTGRYQERYGHELNIPPGYMQGGLPLTERFIGDHLKPLGYVSGLIGKWHLGYPDAYHPNARGFDHFYGLLQGSRGYHPQKNISPHQVFLLNHKPTPEVGYVTDRIGTGACDFLEAHKDDPFFLFVSFTAPHGPLQPRFSDIPKLTGFDSMQRRNFAGLVKALDENVGRILDKLDELKLADKTLVIYTNDNGGQTQVGALNTPLRGRKGQLWEGGVRV
ncbi:MAG: sulfatase-like hydrolase/transferase, partial [Planctomycetales bacterium]|nr:sulfatase-like hydrolase/transferase [Planctomycetales bacterium]